MINPNHDKDFIIHFQDVKKSQVGCRMIDSFDPLKDQGVTFPIKNLKDQDFRQSDVTGTSCLVKKSSLKV